MLTVIELIGKISVEGRRCLAATINDEDILDILAKDENKFVRAAAISNIATKTQTVNNALKDEAYVVRRAAEKKNL